MIDVEKIQTSLVDFINQKQQLNTELLPLLQQKDRQRLLQIMVENTVDDIFMFGKMRNIVGSDPSPPLTDKDREGIKKILFEIFN